MSVENRELTPEEIEEMTRYIEEQDDLNEDWGYQLMLMQEEEDTNRFN